MTEQLYCHLVAELMSTWVRHTSEQVIRQKLDEAIEDGYYDRCLKQKCHHTCILGEVSVRIDSLELY